MQVLDRATSPPITAASAQQPPKLLDQMRAAIRVRGYSLSTEQSYTHVLNRGGRGVGSPLDALG